MLQRWTVKLFARKPSTEQTLKVFLFFLNLSSLLTLRSWQRSNRRLKHSDMPLGVTSPGIAFLLIILAWSEMELIRGVAAQPDAFSACHNNHDVTPQALQTFYAARASIRGLDAEHQLYRWCADDKVCAAEYHLNGADAVTDKNVFRFLSNKWLRPHVSLVDPLNTTFCGHGSLEALLRHSWVLEMRLQSYEGARVQCSSNERFIFSPDTMEGHCVCLEDRNCEGGGSWRSNSTNYSTLSIVVTCVVLLVVLTCQLWSMLMSNMLYQRLMFNCQNKCGSRARFTKSFSQ